MTASFRHDHDQPTLYRTVEHSADDVHDDDTLCSRSDTPTTMGTLIAPSLPLSTSAELSRRGGSPTNSGFYLKLKDLEAWTCVERPPPRRPKRAPRPACRRGADPAVYVHMVDRAIDKRMQFEEAPITTTTTAGIRDEDTLDAQSHLKDVEGPDAVSALSASSDAQVVHNTGVDEAPFQGTSRVVNRDVGPAGAWGKLGAQAHVDALEVTWHELLANGNAQRERMAWVVWAQPCFGEKAEAEAAPEVFLSFVGGRRWWEGRSVRVQRGDTVGAGAAIRNIAALTSASVLSKAQGNLRKGDVDALGSILDLDTQTR
ncbi:hypothetical protein C8F04DRAFT_1230865 [Mycena alexandri]|uniref:Uncharacterized protein n=1 Tax=Mycena alexandri TaxID=1745969 RepID=A0AAD6T6T8_9AGAR|nr:hypothetical protein C8F04DRAFT_1230865 [Mycena alexandri]